MSYTSNYNLNIRLSALEARINALVPPPPGYTYDLLSVLGVGNNAGTFDIDMNANDILDVNNIDLVTINGSAYPPAETQGLQEVLDINNTAIDQSVILESLGTGTQIVRSTLQADPTNNSNLELRLVEPGVSVSLVTANSNASVPQIGTTFIDSGSGASAQNSVRSQLNQSQYLSTVTGGGIGSTTTINTSTGAVQNTGVITDGTSTATNALSATLSNVGASSQWTNGTTLTSNETSANGIKASTITSYADSVSTIAGSITAQQGQASFIATASDPSTGENCSDSDLTLITALVGNKTYNSDATPAPLTVSNHSYQINSANALGGYTWNDNTPGSTSSMSVGFNANPGGATSFVQAFSLSGLTSHRLQMETPIGSSDAVLEHLVPTGINNLKIQSTNRLLLQSTTLNATATNLSMSSPQPGGIAVPLLSLLNTNATGAIGMDIYKAKPTIGVAGDVLFQQSVFGKDTAGFNGNKQEYTRITHTIRDPTSGVEDGSMEMSAIVNGAFQTFIQINGNENETNFLRPLDMTGNNIRTTTGSLAINTASSATAGAVLTLATKDGTPGSGLGLALTGDTLLSGSAGGSSGQHLCLSIGGTVYKIKLENP